METHPHVSSDPAVMAGLPCIRGTRVTVANVVRQVAAGRSIQQIAADYPYLTEESIRDALTFAADCSMTETHDLVAS